MPTKNLTERILSLVNSKGYQPETPDEIARAFGIAEEERGGFHEACRALMHLGRVVLGSSHGLLLPVVPGKISGSYRANKRGFGFVVLDVPLAQGDLYIPKGAARDALTGDVVLAEVRTTKRKGTQRLIEGRVVSVLHRGNSRFVGELHRQGNRWLVVPNGNTLHVPIVVADPGAKDAHIGDQVVVELTQYPDDRREARGVIVRVLGKRGDPGVETLGIIEQYGLPGEFPEAVRDEARWAAASKITRAEMSRREDLRSLTTITIDPVDARDFDDAISVTRSRGRTELGVHIADVAHYVRAGGELDREAKSRANSIYLPRMVIPMLPEVLSNGVCSLQERETRLTRSAFILFDDAGEVIGARFSNSVIKSTKRLTYEKAAEILDGKVGRTSAKVVALLRDADHLARSIRERRLRDGMLVLDVPEVDLVHDDAGRVVGVKPEGREFSHTLIEMFMVEANEAVARALHESGIPNLRRIHEGRAALTDGTLQRFLRVLGHQLPSQPTRHDLQTMLKEVQGKPEAFSVNLAVLRSMGQAEYSPLPLGHFALASEHYCHFTSPIRRYPDLTIHRLFDRHLAAPSSREASEDPSTEALASLGAHCSGQERRAEAAERELKLVFILQLLEDRRGEKFEGTVTGVANVGVFVQLDTYLVDGLLRFEDLPDDWWDVDPQHGTVVGERSGLRITVGNRLQVRISRLHVPTRELQLTLADRLRSGKPANRAASRKGMGARHRDKSRKHDRAEVTPGTPPIRRSRGRKSRRRR